MQLANRRRTTLRAALGLATAALVALAGPAAAGKSKSESQQLPYTSDFRLGDCTFAHDDTADGAGNPYFPLVPGHWLRLENDADVVEITVCDDACDDGAYGVAGDGTKVVDGVTTRVVREMEWEDGELVEVSYNYFARCTRNGGVFYFGEDVDDYEEGEIVGHGGAWLAGGVNAAGLVMPGNFLIGSRYFQEIAPGIALDRADNTADDLVVDLDDFDPFADCVEVTESSGLAASDKSLKVYCPWIGLVFDDGIELTDYFTP
ncbi:MAG: hypothetical protein NDJ75_05535 [Thermoanaerobaculia bacterium]|nr:hypothetical protein [Thermoanaerobaculia bacterium]